jgi:thioredoxin reductase (NADPH)
MRHRKIVVVGSGPAGYSAAIYAARGGLRPLVITGLDFGGQITKTQHLENYPGFSTKIDGLFLTEEMRKQAESFGAEIMADTVVGVDFSKHPFVLRCENGEGFEADAVIVATGTSPRELGLENEKKLVGRGVSYCATCDGFFFKDKEVFVAGGGNAAVYEALHLSTICSKVTLVHRRDSLRAEKIRQEQLFKSPNITVMWDSKVAEIVEADGKLAGLKIENVKTGTSAEYPAAALFVAIGHEPNTGAFKDSVDLDEHGYIKALPDSTATSRDGVFAAGDVKNPRFRQVVIAAAEGAKAAMEAMDFLLHGGA